MNLVLPEIANNRKSSLIYLNNSNKKYIGPIVDISDLENGTRYIGMINDAYNRNQVDNLGIKIIYEIGYQKVTFHFKVDGFHLYNGYDDKANIYMESFYSCWLYSVTADGEGLIHNLNFPNCRDYFRQPLQIKDITFLTDLILEVRLFGNSRGITEKQLCDYKLLNKLRGAYRREQNLQEDFKWLLKNLSQNF